MRTRILDKLEFLGAFGVLLAALGFFYYVAPGPLAAPKTVYLSRGIAFSGIVETLGTEGVVRFPVLFALEAVLTRKARTMHAGEYAFAAHVSPRDVMRMLQHGKGVVHRITVPEGTATRDILAALAVNPLLTGDVPKGVGEGELLPETYYISRGDGRAVVIDRMRHAMAQALAGAWQKRAEGLPFKTPDQALILASIVEKETGLPAERPRVAAVFINRLRRGMALQSDPTVIYAVERATSRKLERLLTAGDLQLSSPYNTYVAPGLPPGPICNPGRASIEAVLHPLQTDELYFVATGNGGHNFSASLTGHEVNVKTYRATQKKPSAKPLSKLKRTKKKKGHST